MAKTVEIATLPACQMDGTAINASHRVVVGEVVLVSPSDEGGLRSTVTLAGGTAFLVPLASHEVAKALGWE